MTLSSALATTCVAAYGDITTAGILPGAQDTTTSTAGTATIVGSPAASTQRQIKSVMIRNAGASTNTVTIKKYDGSTYYPVTPDVQLQAGETMEYSDAGGWRVLNSSGVDKIVASAGGTTMSVQYNNGSGLGGATMVDITSDGHLMLNAESTPTTTPTAPAAGNVVMFGRSAGGRILPAIVGPSGLDTILQPHFGRNRGCILAPMGNGTSVTTIGIATPTATGTATAANVATTNLYYMMKRLEYLVTTASATAVAGSRISVAQFCLGAGSQIGGFHYISRFGPATGPSTTAGTLRMFNGMWATTTAPTDVNPSTLLNIIGVGCDAADANLQMIFNDASGDATKIDLGTSFAKPTSDRSQVYELAMFTAANSGSVAWQVTNLVSGAYVTGVQSTDLPTNTTLLCHQGWCSVGGTSSVVGYSLMSTYIESDF
jgi:hypothetical protein